MGRPDDHPSNWALRLVTWLCPDRLQEGIIGDLLEQYAINKGRKSKWMADLSFVYNSLRFIRYGILRRNRFKNSSNFLAMFRNYFLTSFRALLKQKFYFLLNVIGLSIGIAACLLCYLHLDYELSYDQYHQKSEQVHRLVTGDVKGGNGWVKVSAPMPPALQREIPEIENYARLTNVTRDPQVTVAFENTIFSETQFFMADPSILEIFDIPLIRGQKSQVLADKNSVILSLSAADKYFGLADPIGKTLRVDDRLDFVVVVVAFRFDVEVAACFV